MALSHRRPLNSGSPVSSDLECHLTTRVDEILSAQVWAQIWLGIIGVASIICSSVRSFASHPVRGFIVGPLTCNLRSVISTNPFFCTLPSTVIGLPNYCVYLLRNIFVRMRNDFLSVYLSLLRLGHYDP
jgi:hypothetical protein